MIHSNHPVFIPSSDSFLSTQYYVMVDCCSFFFNYYKSVTYGRAFDASHGNVISRISRSSIEALRENFRDKVTTDDLKLLRALKKVFSIP